jgi:hypothetical protein
MYFAQGSLFVLNTYRSTDECSCYAVSAHSLSNMRFESQANFMFTGLLLESLKFSSHSKCLSVLLHVLFVTGECF